MRTRISGTVGALYVLGWSSLVALYTLAFGSGEQVAISAAVHGALYYTTPPALLGIGVIRASLAMPWSSDRRLRFFARHVLVWLGFAGLSATATVAAFRSWPPFPYETMEAETSWWAIFIGQFFIGSLMYCLLVGFTYAAMGEIRTRQQAAAAARAETLRAQAELKALRAQVNPHFLFNTLHSLLALVRRDPPAAEEALEQFGDLMRYALRFQRELRDEVPLAEEWAFCTDYLALETLRLGSRLRLEASIDDEALSRDVPAFSLQPLLENAIRHAVAPRAEGGAVRVTAAVVDGRLRLEVADGGPGSSAAEIAASDGTGLRLLRDRLAALYGGDASLVAEGTGSGFTAVLDLPAKRSREASTEQKHVS